MFGWIERHRSDEGTIELAAILGQILAVWVLSDLGYYLLLPELGVDLSYNASPLLISLYYLFWIGAAVIVFWPVYGRWSRHARWATFESRFASLLVWTMAFVGSVLFAAYLLPSLPKVVWTQSWSPPDLIGAGPLYFVPKSVDILLQQLLIVALTIVLAERWLSLLKI